MTAFEDESLMLTSCAPAYVPAAGEKVGVGVVTTITDWLMTPDVTAL
jgi:hypothetical protein